MVNEKDIVNVISKHSDLARIVQKVGQRYILSGFDNEDAVVLAAYIYELIEGVRLKGYRASDTLQIYQLIGGNTTKYQSECKNAQEKGYVNLEPAGNTLYPTLSSRSGSDRVYELLGKFTNKDLRIIKAGETYTAKKKFEQFLDMAVLPSNEILLVDAYVSPLTLKYLTQLFTKVKKARILTSNIIDSLDLKVDIKNFESEGDLTLEIKKGKEIHDRFISSEKGVWTLGTSLKDFGKKDCIISDVSSARDSLEDLFSERWESGKPWWNGSATS